MFKTIREPKGDEHGIIVINRTVRVSELESQIWRSQMRPATHKEIRPDHAEESPDILITIGSTVLHPEHNSPSFFGFNRKGEKIHVLASHGTLNPDVRVLVGVA